MSIPPPRFKFKSDRSSFRKLVFEVSDPDWRRYEVELIIDLVSKKSQIVGINESKGVLFIPLELYDLEESERDQLISEQYQDHVRGRFTMFLHSRVLRLFDFAENRSYTNFVEWLDSGLLNIDSKL